jgi:hypothetical protein
MSSRLKAADIALLKKKLKYLLFIMLLLGAEGPSSVRYPNNLKGRRNLKADDGSLASLEETLKGKKEGGGVAGSGGGVAL